MNKPFRKEADWAEVYARQAKRAELVGGWLDALRLKPGGRVLDIGSGPGYVSFFLAERVGPSGVVYAIDRSAAALAYLERLQTERGVPQIRRIAADAAMLDPQELKADAALVTMVLHHGDDPAGVLRSVARLLRPDGILVIGEFHPDGPCEVGAAREHRLAPAQLRTWCESAGLTVVDEQRQTAEHYMLVAQQHA